MEIWLVTYTASPWTPKQWYDWQRLQGGQEPLPIAALE